MTKSSLLSDGKARGVVTRALKKKKIPFLRIVNATFLQAGYGCKQKRFAYSDVNSSASAIIAEEKGLTRELLEKCDVPIAKGARVETWEELKAVYDKLKKPVVVKPVGEMQGKGISVDLNNLKETEAAFKIAKSFGKMVIIEEHVEGDDTRILIINNEFVAGLKRMRPFVFGDGKLSIAELIEEENKKRKKTGKHIIRIEETVNLSLAKQEYTMASIPKKDEKVFVRQTCNLCAGGVSEDVTEIVHPDNIELAKKIACYFNLDIVGMDFLTTDITKPLKETGGAVTEVNQNPDVLVHQEPDIGKPRMTAEMLVDYIFPKIEDAWIPIFFNGKKVKDQSVVDNHLEVVPKKVKQFHAKDYKRIIIVDKPEAKLYNYLIDPLTCEIVIK